MYPFDEGSFAPRNGWYVAAHAVEVGRQPLPRDILGEPVVLYRREDGRAVAVGGRCPHRHYPLGCGTLRGDAIICGYHGIAFGDDGRCLSIPSQATLPGAVRIPTYPLAEHGLWLFIWMGGAEPDFSTLPPLAESGLDEPGMLSRAFFVDEVKARAQLLNDNLLDLSHVGFLHSSTIGTEEDAKAEERFEKGEHHVRVRRYTCNVTSPPVAKDSGLYSGLIDRVVGGDFHLPGIHFTIAETRYPADHPDHGGESISRGWFYHGITPVTPTTSRYFFSVSLRGTEADLDQMERITRGINTEDIEAAERIEEMLRKLENSPQDLLIRADRAAVEGRRMLQEMMDREQTPLPADVQHA